MSELIDRQAAIEVIDAVFPVDPMKSEYAQGIACGAALAKTYVEQLPAAQSESLTLRVNSELTKEEYDKLMQDIKDAPIVLLPSAQTEREMGEWLHDLLQDAIDAGIITETQASRLMDRIAEDNT